MNSINIRPLRKIYIFLLVILNFSCDSLKLCLINDSELYSIDTDCGEIKTSMYRSRNRGYLYQSFYGEGFTICVDSLKIESGKYNVKRKQMENKSIKSEITPDYIVKNGEVVSRIFIISLNKETQTDDFSQSEILHILPCSYIKCNGGPSLTDSLKIDISWKTRKERREHKLNEQ